MFASIAGLLDRLDERGALEDDRNRRSDEFAVGCDLAFPGKCIDDDLDGLVSLSAATIRNSEVYFQATATKVGIDNGRLIFPSPVSTAVQENSTAMWQWFPCANAQDLCVVIPHWNSNERDYASLCKILVLLNYEVVKMVLPYHFNRRPASQNFAEQMVSANLGRTIQSIRQAVAETLTIVDWALSRPFKRVHLIGASLGSCIAAIGAANSRHIASLTMIHVANDFAKVVWAGRATRHLRAELEGKIALEELSESWAVISPGNYADKLGSAKIPALIFRATRDRVFVEELGVEFVRQLRSSGVPIREFTYPCGHYTIAHPPFAWFVLFRLHQFLRSLAQ